MDAEQRYIRESKYTLEHNFLDALTSVPLSVSMRVAKFIDQCYDQISASEKEHRTYGGVVHVAGEAVFFSVEVMIDDELTVLKTVDHFDMSVFQSQPVWIAAVSAVLKLAC